ncbi:MAG TPA: family 78 glycoside hydrolase catalytic domain [Opitutaceae bacterium]|nr:family 78 glycoside hydrolase catalytic domain [Opitutaceae bacterium]
MKSLARTLRAALAAPVTIRCFALVLVLFSAAGFVHAAETLRVTYLKCEYGADPLGIDVPQPRLFWQLESDDRGQRQTAWQVLAASSLDALAKDQGDLWDSGRVASDETTFVRYAGKPLASSQQVFWKVRAWDRDGKPSAWSRPATWTMGILDEWEGAWIASSSATETLLLRHEFDIRNGLRRAVVHVSGLGQYELSLNGAKVGDALLSPGWTNYNKTTLYDTFDVTAQLQAGRNAIGIFLGNGMYNVVRRDLARFSKFAGSFGPLRAIVNLRLEYADGRAETIATDEHWRTHAGPVTFSSIYGGEDHDARLEPANWNRAGFDDSSWALAVRQSPPGKTLRGFSEASEALRAIEVLRPVGSRAFPDGTVVYDLGQNASIMPRLRVTGPAGSVVRLIPAEVTNPDGTINRNTMGSERRGISWWQYTKATDAEESWMPRFFYSGGRYLKAIFTPAQPGGALPKLELLEGVVVHSSAEPVGQFATSNPLLNRIRELVRWSQRSNFVSVLTDCPHREKLGWLEQYHLNGPALRYEFDAARIFTKGMHDMSDAQTEDGLIPNIAPEYTKFKGSFRAAAEWGGSFLIVPWQQYDFTGDTSLLLNYYPAMKRYFAYLESKTKDGVLSEGLGDWYDLGPKKPGFSQQTPPPITATAYYFNDAKLLARVAALAGKPDEAQDYERRAEAIRVNYNRVFYHADKGSYATGSQSANALPLVFGIVDPAERPRVFASLIHAVESVGDTVTAGDIGYRYLLLALAQGGRSDLIYRMINQDEKPGYGYILKKGETSLTEAWDANLSSSHNHFMLGQITEWFYGHLVGLRSADGPAGAGFKKIVIAPEPVGDLTWAEASYHSIHGLISVRWERQPRREETSADVEAKGDFKLSLSIPANTTAEVSLPSRGRESVRESGKPVAQITGVKFLRREGDRDIFAIESGRYEFVSTIP